MRQVRLAEPDRKRRPARGTHHPRNRAAATTSAYRLPAQQANASIGMGTRARSASRPRRPVRGTFAWLNKRPPTDPSAPPGRPYREHCPAIVGQVRPADTELTPANPVQQPLPCPAPGDLDAGDPGAQAVRGRAAPGSSLALAFEPGRAI